MTNDSERGRYKSPKGSPLWEYIATINCSIAIFSVGCILGWNAPSFHMLMGPDSPIVVTETDLSTLGAVVGLGCTLAPVLNVVMADKLGRRKCLLAAISPTLVSWGIIAVAKDVKVLFVARFLGGLTFGLIVCVAPMYLGEIASVKLRGALGMVIGITTNAGILFMFVVGPYLSIQMSACICLSIATLAMIGIWFIPESPYFLAMVGKFDEAKGALVKLRGKTDVTEELEMIKSTVRPTAKSEEGELLQKGQEARKKSSAYKQLFMTVGNRKSLCINMLFPLALQFGGYVVTMVFGQIVFEAMKPGLPAHFCIMVIAGLQLIFNVITAFIIDRVGRRPLICVSGTISGACVLVVGVYFYLMEYKKMDVTAYGMVPFWAMVIYIIAMNIGLMPLQMVVLSETLDTEVKALGTCLVAIAGGVMTTIISKLYLALALTWGFGHSVPFFGFCATTWTCTVLILKLLPETKGKTFLEIQKDLSA